MTQRYELSIFKPTINSILGQVWNITFHNWSDSGNRTTKVYGSFFFDLKMSRFFTREEIGKHNCRENCWIIVENQVIDITQYMNDHPGGEIIKTLDINFYLSIRGGNFNWILWEKWIWSIRWCWSFKKVKKST